MHRFVNLKTYKAFRKSGYCLITLLMQSFLLFASKLIALLTPFHLVTAIRFFLSKMVIVFYRVPFFSLVTIVFAHYNLKLVNDKVIICAAVQI